MLKHSLYNKSFKTHIGRLYSNLKRRTQGKGCKSPELYKGLAICTKEEFYTFAINSDEFTSLYNTWMENKFNIKYTPSVNRKDTTKGYEIDNIEFITFSENCKLAHINRTNYRGRFSK